jgi:anti-anti-sigma regulatory factor
MLRITVCNELETTRLVVEGKLAGACVSELEKSWQAVTSVDSKGRILVDLSGITFIDESGKRLLTRMHDYGIRFIAIGIMPKSLIEEIESTPA